MAPLLPLAFALIVLVVLEVVSYRALDRYATGLDSLPTVVMEEFPEIDRDLLGKFSSFDPELGWSPQPNMSKQKDTGDHLPGEEVRTVVTYSTDAYGSRVCPAKDRPAERTADADRDRPDAPEGRTDGGAATSAPTADATDADDAAGRLEGFDGSVSTYGDSYCFCREVDDSETFQNYLAQELDTHVGNYGGGNYGLDQALLRLKRRYPDDPTDYVVMVVTASSIARVRSVWKHYQEFGNVLAVKPRYERTADGLRLVETPIDEKEDLLDLPSHADFLREHDFHYDHWFRAHYASFPYAPTFLGDADHVRYAAYGAIKDLEKRYEVSIPGIDADAAQTRTVLRLEQERVRYHERLFEERSELFERIIGEFVDYADEQDFTPVFAMVQQLRYATYEAEHGPIYGDLLDRLDDRYDDLVTVDVADHLAETDDPEAVQSLYVERGEGGHYSPETNRRIAELLVDEVFEPAASG